MAEIRGVNLGNWLVLEQWMDPTLFEGIQAENLDETSFSEKLGNAKFERLKYHRDHFIVKQDFEWIKKAGLNSVRIPVPHWIFDDCEPYVGCIDYLDKGMEWAREAGLSVLIDLHTAPGCQNGFDNGGITGVCDWYKSEKNIERTIMVLEKLAARYKDHKALYGLEFLNEPSWDNPMEIVRDFYEKAYVACRKHLDEDKALVFHDRFAPMEWADFMVGPEYKNIVLDTHIYQCFDEALGKLHPAQNTEIVLSKRMEELKTMAKTHKIIIGEWSLGLSGNEYFDKFTPVQNDLALRAYAAAQLLVQEESFGWYFWSYKLMNTDMDGWNYRTCFEKGWMPAFDKL